MQPRFVLIALLALASCRHAEPAGGSPFAVGTQPQGIAAFSRFAKVAAAKVSPKGTYIAALADEGGRRSLTFINVATRKALVLNPAGESSIGRFYWANDERLVIELVDSVGYLAAPVSRGEIFAVDANGRGARLIFGYRAGEAQVGSHIRRAESDAAWGFVVSPLRNDPSHVLIEETSMREVSDRVAEIYKLDVYTGVKTRVARSPLAHAQFFTDENGELRIAAGNDDAARPKYFYFDGAWRELDSIRGFSSSSRPLAFVARDRVLYVSEPVQDGFAVYAVSIDTGERKLVLKTQIAPVEDLVRDATGRVVAAEYEPDLPAWEFVDRSHPLSRVLQGMLAAYPNEHVEIVNTTDDDRKALVRVYSDRDPGRFLLVDVATMSAEPIADARPWVKPDSMAEMSAFHIPASDGFRIHGYITTPPGAQPGKPPPLIVLPHGGPHGVRDYWRFDPQVQLLAHEGYAVLQVNYRGSGGYGEAYQEAGYRKWGDRVVQDIIDATRFVVRKGYADPARICIFGGSFGAYAAIEGSIRAPDLYKCAVGYSGIYDLALLSKAGDIRLERQGRAYLSAAVGQDEAALQKASPVYHADQIAARVFLIHGRKDERAPFEHAEALRDALAARSRPPEWLVEPKEGHGFYDEAARERMYQRLLEFFKKSLSR
ncbi:MAG: alpha/beta hydrolase family protein [Myxococcales bacterium]|nr:S9 family peptidase [Myxococcales bacterium]